MHTYPQNNSTRSVQHSKELALDPVEYESLLHGAAKIDDTLMRLQAEFAVLALGRLGLRAGELAHLDEDWIDWRRDTIQIPGHDPCEKGRDGGPCARCLRLAQQVVDHADVELDHAQVASTYWQPKTSNGARGVFFGWDPRVQYTLERFFDHWTEWPRSVQVVNRRVTRAAEHAPLVDADEISPHPLRATAASHMAGRGLGHSAMMQHFGWADFSVAAAYIETSTDATARQLSALQSR